MNIETINNFSLQLTAKSKNNSVLSGKNIIDAFSLVYPGSSGETEKELGSFFGLNSDSAKEISELDNDLGSRVQLTTAKSAWAQIGYPFNKDYIEAIKNLNADLDFVDYAGNVQYIVEKINTWVKQKTKDLIPQLVDESFFNDKSRLTLVSAIHFLGKFVTQFNKKDTKPRPFYLEDGSQTLAETMYLKSHFQVNQKEKFSVLSLPYAGNISLNIILPNIKYKLDEICHLINHKEILSWSSYSEEYVVEIPKFKIESSFELIPVLKELGLKNTLSESADFSKMLSDTNEKLAIGNVIHKAVIETDEEGTEAAAATAIGMMICTNFMPFNPTKIFKADRPFLFFIKDDISNVILFSGKYINP